MLGDPVAVLVPGPNVVLGGRSIEAEELRVLDIGPVPRPQELSPAGIQDIEVGRQIVPEVPVVLVIDRGRPVPLVDLPVRAEIAGRADPPGELAQHVQVERAEAEHLGPGGLMGDVAHAEREA